MTTPSQLETVRREIADTKAKILKTEEAVAAAQKPADIAFLRILEQLNRQLSCLREQETIVLQAQQSGEQWLLCYLFPPLRLTWLSC